MDQTSLTKPPVSDAQFSASIPWEGVRALSSHWAGAGSLFDWIGPADWDIERDWTAETMRARMAEVILRHIQQFLLKHIPQHAGEWLDALSQQTHRQIIYSDTPSAHTDWSATLSSFGRYPSETYIDRRPVQTYDSSFTRVLNWVARAILRADRLVLSRFGRYALSVQSQRKFLSALELPEVTGAATEERLSDFDLEVCKHAGGLWLSVSRVARLISALWSGNATAQLFALKPILPDFAHQLFELGVLGALTTSVRGVATNARWSTASPLAAAGLGRSSLTMQSDEGRWDIYYQSVPVAERKTATPYRHLTKDIDGGSLRPDIWINQELGKKKREIVFECKYSLNPNYICTGVPQIFAYLFEFPPVADVDRIHVVVGPEEVVPTTQVWGGQFALTNPSGAQEICRRSFTNSDSNFLSILESAT